MRRLGRAAIALAFVVAVGGERSASAANGAKPRIPVNWSAAACATIVDRSATPTVHFDYTVPEEDVPEVRTADEVDDSRTHQFFAFRKQDARDVLPTWITHADIVRSAMVDPEVVEANIDPEDILEDTSRFAADDWVRITADDARVPISDAQAAMGVDWDVSAVAPGTYQIYGYTWEPVRNLWSPRAGFVKVIASTAEAAAAGPSIILDRDEAQITAGTPYTLPGCVDVSPGSVVSVEWGEVVGTMIPTWEFALVDAPIDSGPLALEFVAPDEAGGKKIKLRATVTDTEGRSYTAYSPAVLAVAPNPDPGSGDDGGGDDGGCAVAPRPGAPAWLVLLLLAAPCRPRRRGRDH